MKQFKVELNAYKKQLALAGLLAASSLPAQQNGLNNSVSFPNIEMGGPLIRPTNVTLENGGTQYDLVFNGEGLVGVGNLLGAGSLGGSRVLLTHVNTAPTTGYTPIYNTLTTTYYSATSCPSDVIVTRNAVVTDAPGYYLKGEYTTVQGDARIAAGNHIEVISNATGAGTESYGVFADTYGAIRSWGGHFTAIAPTGVSGSIAYGTEAIGKGDNDAVGGIFRGNGAATTYGVFGEAVNAYSGTNALNIGAAGQALAVPGSGSNLANIGVIGGADYVPLSLAVAGYLGGGYQQFLPNIRAAVYGNAVTSTYTVGVPYAGYFDGDVQINGAAYCTANAWTVSDKRLKKEITPISNSQQIISRLQPKTFLYNKENELSVNVSDRRDYGIIAQELEEVLPELVRETISPAVKDKSGKTVREEKTYKTVNYTAFFGILIANAQEQQKQLNEQKELIEQQQKLISELQQKTGAAAGLSQNSADITGFSMSQNEPNPFTHETVIKYDLPATVASAYMAVYDLSGKQIERFALDQKGASSISVTSEKLAAGIYLYSIVADGKVMDSKKMIVADK